MSLLASCCGDFVVELLDDQLGLGFAIVDRGQFHVLR